MHAYTIPTCGLYFCVKLIEMLNEKEASRRRREGGDGQGCSDVDTCMWVSYGT